jgi:hypothetical protein
MDPEAIKLFWILTAVGSAGAIIFGIFVIVNAVVRRVAGPEEKDGEDLEYLKERVEQVEYLEQRVAELENRVEFAERLLAAPRPDEITPLPDK